MSSRAPRYQVQILSTSGEWTALDGSETDSLATARMYYAAEAIRLAWDLSRVRLWDTEENRETF